MKIIGKTWRVICQIDIQCTTGTYFSGKFYDFCVYFLQIILTTRWWQNHVRVFWVGCDLGNPSAVPHKGTTTLKCFSHFSWIKVLGFTSDHFYERIKKERMQAALYRPQVKLHAEFAMFQCWPMQIADDISFNLYAARTQNYIDRSCGKIENKKLNLRISCQEIWNFFVLFCSKRIKKNYENIFHRKNGIDQKPIQNPITVETSFWWCHRINSTAKCEVCCIHGVASIRIARASSFVSFPLRLNLAPIHISSSSVAQPGQVGNAEKFRIGVRILCETFNVCMLKETNEKKRWLTSWYSVKVKFSHFVWSVV